MEHPLTTTAFTINDHPLERGLYWLSRDRWGRIMSARHDGMTDYRIGWYPLEGVSPQSWGPPTEAWRLPMLLVVFQVGQSRTLEEPTESSGGDGETAPAEAHPAGPTAAREAGRGAANAPPLPAVIEGPDLMASGGDTVYTARLD